MKVDFQLVAVFFVTDKAESMMAYLFEKVLPFLITCATIVLFWAAYDLWQEMRENE
jgi:hypothetical protein